MAASGDDLRYFYSARLGDTQTVAVTDAGSTKVAEALTPGRYIVHLVSPSSASGLIWIRQGPHASVAATAAAPSTPLSGEGLRAIEITVRPVAANSTQLGEDGIAAIGASSITATIAVTKISRGKN